VVVHFHFENLYVYFYRELLIMRHLVTLLEGSTFSLLVWELIRADCALGSIYLMRWLTMLLTAGMLRLSALMDG
jgi:hypothetical protein